MKNILFIFNKFINLKSIRYISFLISFHLISSTSVWAVQTHGGAEGLVSHQIGHLLFIAGMGYLLFCLRQFQISQTGWREFKLFLFTIIAWNCLTFAGHWMNEFVDPQKFIKINGKIAGFNITSFFDFIFYLSRLDHLLLIPAFIFLLIAINKWKLEKP